jgi:propionate CoA-transferase
MSKIITVQQAAALIKDGDTVAAAVAGMSGWPEEIAIELEKRFLEKGAPKNLTLVHGAGCGNFKDKGAHHFGHAGMVKRWVGGHIGASPGMARLVSENKCEAYNLPQGVIVQLYRDIAAKRPGLISKVGLGTFVDPRIEGGKMNTVTTEEIVKLIELEDEEYLLYKAFPIQVALIRGTTIDEKGNLTTDKEGVALENLPLAQAVKNNGGIVIAQVEYLAQANTLHPKQVQVPGVLVDYVVVASPENHMQTMGEYYNPAFSGDLKVALNVLPEMALDERLIIARRAAMELVPNCIVNLGIGIPADGIAGVAGQEGVAHMMTLTTEIGGIGGVPAGMGNFGHTYNAEMIVDQQAQFDWYDGGGVDVAFLGLAQADQQGNINVSKFNGRAMGCGGFINITQNSKKVVYCGTFTSLGLKTTIENGKLVIAKEGTGKKFLQQVEQITFSGQYAAQNKQPVLYITERAVFTLKNGEITLTEIAPGVDLDKDILAQMEFAPAISPELKSMPAEIFQPRWGNLKNILAAKVK